MHFVATEGGSTGRMSDLSDTSLDVSDTSLDESDKSLDASDTSLAASKGLF